MCVGVRLAAERNISTIIIITTIIIMIIISLETLIHSSPLLRQVALKSTTTCWLVVGD